MLSKKIKSIIISVTMCVSLLFSGTVFADQNKVNVERLAGQDRYETNSKIVDKGWDSADSVILCNSNMFADAIVCAPLSKKLNAPILLTDGVYYFNDAMQEIKRLGAKNIYIIGGTGVIPSGVEAGLKSQGYNTIRIAGANRYETSLEVAKYFTDPSTVYFTDGNNWQDALSISPIAAKLQAPIILGSRTSYSDKVNNYLANVPSGKITILDDNAFSGTKGVSEVSGLVGANLLIAKNPLEMNENIIRQYKDQLNFNNVYLASSSTFADALSGSALASKNDNPIILVNRDNRKNSYDIINNSKNNIKTVSILGGEGVIGDDGISNIFDVTGLVQSTDSNNQTPTTPTQPTNTTPSNIINSATIQDYYSLLHEDGSGKFSNFADDGMLNVLHNNDIMKSINSGISMASNNNIYGFLKLIGNSNNIKSMTYFFKGALPGAKSISTNVDSHKGLIIVSYSTNQKLMGDAVVAIEYNKDINKFEICVQNYSFLPDNVHSALKEYGFSVISNNTSQVSEDCGDADYFNAYFVKNNESEIVDILRHKNNMLVYTGNNEKDTSYGKYENGIYVLQGNLNSFITFVSSNINQ